MDKTNPVFFCDLADDSGRVASRQYSGGNISCHHATGADDGIRADGHISNNGDSTAYPHVISHGDGQGALIAGCPFHVIEGMFRCIEAHVGANPDIVPETDLGTV